jgi:hypothetical protein
VPSPTHRFGLASKAAGLATAARSASTPVSRPVARAANTAEGSSGDASNSSGRAPPPRPVTIATVVDVPKSIASRCPSVVTR